ncbi:hypothetical protein [Pectobacterium versatile]|uniref:hypothetical protein n=1 Tax=Pectobacterium versatile TaxID=2488639 RepID=UPI001F3BB533|nr:hypothetical protein [Pectobacterium versatile]
MEKADRDFLHRQLVKLGDMIGDGLHYESDGKWIPKEYRRVAKALGYDMPATKNPHNEEMTIEINARMAARISEVSCKACGGELKQVRSGSMRASCKKCGAKFQLMKKVRRSAA